MDKVHSYKDESGLQLIKIDFVLRGPEIKIASRMENYFTPFISVTIFRSCVKVIKQLYGKLRKYDISAWTLSL